MLTTLALFAIVAGKPADPLASAFVNPPASARPHTWWHWMNGNVTKEGITADLEAMKDVGIGGAQMFTVDQNIPAGPAGYMGAKWRELTAHAVKEAGRLGIELCMHNCAGWSSSGGPWIKPEDAMQVLAWSETDVEGPNSLLEPLPRPEAPKVFRKVDYYRDIAVYAYRTPEGDPARPTDFLGRTGVVRENGIKPDLTAGGVPAKDIVDLTGRLKEDGRLDWEIPAGRWTILRMGHVPTGKDNHPAPPEGNGLEVDKLSREALDKHWNAMMAKVIADAGPLAGKVLNNGLIDSYEVGGQNWTPKFREDFQRLRGYDPMPYLPVVAGLIVESKAKSERFLWDFRRTIADLFAANYFGHFADLCHKAGLQFSTEPYGDGGFDNIQSGSTADIPMGEFWTAGWAIETTKLASSIGHVYGRPVIGAESFTADETSGRWLEEPYAMKVIGDRAFCEGINRYIFHRYAHQPWLDVKPGMTMGPWGTHFDRTQTWWTEAKEWLRYVARCQNLLQKGRFVADVVYYYGEDAPMDLPARENLRPKIPAGYDYDGCDAAAVRSMTVKNGRLVLPSGMSYSVLVLPESTFMTPAMARKVRDLVAAGATVVGPKARHTPSLSGFPESERETQSIADEVWGAGAIGSRRFGKGRIVTGLPLANTLSTLGLKPDFEFASGTLGTHLQHIHRKIDGADVYFVSNQAYRTAKSRVTFRVKGMAPELWHPDTGKMEDAPAYEDAGGRTSFNLNLGPAESVFVVFRKPASPGHLASFAPVETASANITNAIKIQKAWYGSADGRGLDVTEKVRGLLAKGQLDVPATNALFGDSVPMVPKRLTVDLTIGGKAKRIDVAENEMAVLVGEPNEAPRYALSTRPDGVRELTPWLPGTYSYKVANGLTRTLAVREGAQTVDLSQKWDVAFEAGRGAPGQEHFATLVSWPEHGNQGVRYFSGSATYTRDLELPPTFVQKGQSVRLDLGTVKNFATVTVNGQMAATLWKPPFVQDVTPFVRPGKNRIVVKVTNLWPNRMIGDEQLPPEMEWNGTQPVKWPAWLDPSKPRIAGDRPKTGRITFATWHPFTKDSPLLPSGLIGPVRIQSAKRVVVGAG
ncbi:hypothetical protein EON81_00900 [bacterium]|nr:MAG: hypothetical protein EON81_00900 [bacterium]